MGNISISAVDGNSRAVWLRTAPIGGKARRRIKFDLYIDSAGTDLERYRDQNG